MSILKKLSRLVRPRSFSGPSTLAEAIAFLKQELPSETLRAMREDPENEMARYHHNLGRQIRNRWGLWSGSPLKGHLEGLGLNHADDMSSLILTSLRRHLRGEPLRVEEQVKKHQEYWATVELSSEMKGCVFKL